MDVVDGLSGELADIRHHAVSICEALLLRDLRDDRVDVADDGGVFLRRLGSGSEMLLAAEKAGLRAASEVFADRGYQSDGTLVPRSQPGAMITDETLAIERVVRMVTEGVVTAIDGTDVPLRADSICVHGDGEKALLFVRKIRAALEAKGVALRAL